MKKIEINPTELQSFLESCARSYDLDVVLKSVEVDVPLDGTKGIAHCYCLTIDGNDNPNDAKLASHLISHILKYAIPRSRFDEAMREVTENNSEVKIINLFQEASSLFVGQDNTGEPGEVLLSYLAENYLKLPQLLSKISLKTADTMYFHGADAIHVNYDSEEGKIGLFWGESKIYKNGTDAIRDCVKDMSKYLLNYELFKQNRDILILQDYIDLGSKENEEIIKLFLDKNNPLSNLVNFKGLGLVGYDSKLYDGRPIDSLDELTKNIGIEFNEMKSKLSEKINENNIENFEISIFLIPFSSVEIFKAEFLKGLKVKGL